MPVHTRRRFLRLLAQGAFASTLPPALWAQETGTDTVSIFHTTDLHGHILPTTDYAGHGDLGGLARCATQIRRWRAANPSSLTLDVGDVYQGTEVALRTRGATMIRCLNALAYDAWVVGNHEFDWGADAFAAAVQLSQMPVLSGNALIAGRPAGSHDAATTGPLARIQPYLIKEVAGYRIAICSLTTPALTTWIPPEHLRDFEATDPAQALAAQLAEIAAHKPDAILLAGHMGLKRADDFANQVGKLTETFPQVVVCLGGHTHQDFPGTVINGVLYTQADHFGIHAGRIDLTFDRPSRRLLHRASITVRMDHTVPLDSVVMSIGHNDLAQADLALAQPMGACAQNFSAQAAPGEPSDLERLIGSSIVAALQKRGVAVDAVLHGLFGNVPLPAGARTVADAWTVLPYENDIVTVDLSYADLLRVAQEAVQRATSATEPRHLLGVRVATTGFGAGRQLTGLLQRDGRPLAQDRIYRLAVNSYDSQSGGQRYPELARLVATPANQRVLHPLQVRDALVEFFTTRGEVTHASLLV